jgi:hypothetical protein
MATYKERMENLEELKKSYNFTPKQIYQMTSYKVGDNGGLKVKSISKPSRVDEQARKLKILDYLKKARDSAIRRGMYNQNVLSTIESEAQKNA